MRGRGEGVKRGGRRAREKAAEEEEECTPSFGSLSLLPSAPPQNDFFMSVKSLCLWWERGKGGGSMSLAREAGMTVQHE